MSSLTRWILSLECKLWMLLVGDGQEACRACPWVTESDTTEQLKLNETEMGCRGCAGAGSQRKREALSKDFQNIITLNRFHL